MRVAQGSHLDAGSEAILPRLCLWLSGHDPDHSSALHSSVAQGETHVLFLGPKFPYLRIVGWGRHGGYVVDSFWRPSKLWARPSSAAPPWHTTHTKTLGRGMRTAAAPGCLATGSPQWRVFRFIRLFYPWVTLAVGHSGGQAGNVYRGCPAPSLCLGQLPEGLSLKCLLGL